MSNQEMDLLPMWILISVFVCSSSSSITMSCFSFPILDLPSFGFSSSSGLYVQSGVNFLTNVGANTTATVDGCLWGLASLLLLEILPTILSGEAAQLLDRISSSSFPLTSHSPEKLSSTAPTGGSSQTGYADYDSYGAIGTGNRRLDVNEYEYIDTSPTNLYHNPFHGHPQADQEVAGLQVTPYGRGNGIEVTPILRDADPDVPQWSQPILSKNDFGWSEPKKMLGPSFQQDYDDIDYTSGGLVTFHSSLS